MALKKGTLKPGRVARLNAIGFQTDPLTEKWNQQFSKLEAYHADNGHCNVPRRYTADLALYNWVRRQRASLKNGTLKPERATRLHVIGFQTERLTETWNRCFPKLEAYRAHNGHCNVSRGYALSAQGSQRRQTQAGTGCSSKRNWVSSGSTHRNVE
jgi:hypothetical protein